MGLGTTKKKLVVFTATQRMIDDAAITESSKAAIMRYLIENDGKTSASLNDKTIPDYLIEASQNSIPAKFNKAYNYANTGSYAYGLPTANNVTFQGVDITPTVKAYIESVVGHTVSMLYCKMGDGNYQHFMWKKLIDSYGYNPTTNELTTLSTSVGFPCYLKTGKLYYGMATVNSDETGETLNQYGLSTESGECLTRAKDLNRALVPIDVDTTVQDAYATITYQYIEVIPDTTAPPVAVINTLNTNTIEGYAEKDSTVDISVNSVFRASVVADSNGYFTYTFSPALVNGDTVTTVVKDSVPNSSTGLDTVVPYTNGTPATVGTGKTITEVTHTESFNFNFLDYIPSAVPIIPAEADDTPVTVVGDDSYVPEYDYIQAGYTYVVSGTTHIGYLTYAYGTNTIPALENLFSTSSAAGQFYPRLYARIGGQDLVNTLSTSSNEYKSSLQLARMLGLNWKDWSKTLHESIEDIADVQQLFTTMAVPMNTSDPVIREYLFRYWFKTHEDLPTLISTGDLVALNGKEGNTLEVKDNAYAHYVSFNAVTSHVVTGTIGSIGTYTSDYLNEYEAAIAAGYSPDTGVVEYTNTVLSAYPAYHVYRWQNTATTYREVRVYGARSVHNFSGASTTALGEDETLVIPLDRTATTYMTPQEKETLYAKCLYLFVNMAKIVKVKWYQRGAFKIVMNIIAIVIAVVTVGAGAPLSAYLLAIVNALVINIAINVAIRLLIKLGVSEEIAGILVFIAALRGVGVNLSNLAQLGSLTALQLLQAASLAFQVTNKILAINMQELQKEAELFYQESQEKQASLKQAKELLNNDVIDLELDLLLGNSRSQVFIKLGEKPEDFLGRSPLNVTQLSNRLVENYVDIMLQPPSLADMLNQTKRGDYAYDV